MLHDRCSVQFQVEIKSLDSVHASSAKNCSHQAVAYITKNFSHIFLRSFFNKFYHLMYCIRPCSVYIGMPVSYMNPGFFSNMFTIRKICCLSSCFNPRYSFCIILTTLSGDCVLQNSFTTVDACTLVKFILNKIQFAKEICCNCVTL